MKYRIMLAPEAAEDLNELRAYKRADVLDTIEAHLRSNPENVSKSRIKRLRDMKRPKYRLRVGELRVFYDVVDETVEVLAIVEKPAANSWLELHGEKS